jgi:hypothetical protein
MGATRRAGTTYPSGAPEKINIFFNIITKKFELIYKD